MKAALVIFVAISLALFATINAQTYTIYSNGALQAGWDSWSWSTNNLRAAERTRGGHSGSWSMLMADWGGNYAHGAFAGTSDQISSLSFWISGDGTADQSVGVQFFDAEGKGLGQQVKVSDMGVTIGNSWTQVSTSMAPFKLAAGTALGGLVFQAITASGPAGTVFFDDITYSISVKNTIYSNGALSAAFQNWSWATNSLQSIGRVTSGHTSSWSMAIKNWDGIYAHGSFIATSDAISSFAFSISGDGTSGQEVAIQFYAADNTHTGNQLLVTRDLGVTIGNGWVQVNAPFSRFNIPAGTALGGVVLQGQGANSAGTVYFDDIVYTTAATGSSTTAATVASVAAAATSAATVAATTATTATTAATSATTVATSATTAATSAAATSSSSSSSSSSCPSNNPILALYKTQSSGDGTYYGQYAAGGACTLDPTPSSGITGINVTVAIGSPVFYNSGTCGMCLQVTGSGSGAGANPIIGTYSAFVNNLCPECSAGSLDFGLSGDGRWGIKYIAVPCPVTGNVQYMTQGSNDWYLKIQVRNTKIPAASLQLQINGQWMDAPRSADNFFILNAGVQIPYASGVPMKVTSIDGQVFTDKLYSFTNGQIINGGFQFGPINPACLDASASTSTTAATTVTTATTAATTVTSAATTAATTITTATTAAATTSTTSTSGSTSGTAAACSTSGLSICIDPSTDGNPVNPAIYGVSFASSANLAAAKYKINRWGGNSATRYNWQIDVSNKGSDWFFENIAETVANEAALPSGSSSDKFISDSLNGGASVILTLPTIGWTPASRTNKLCSFAVSKYGAQQSTDQWAPDCGNGYRNQYDQNGHAIPVTGNNPSDCSKTISAQFDVDWLAHIDSVFGAGQVPYVQLDNEPCLWHETHRDIHPQKLGYDELWSYTVTYATAIKNAYPNIKIAGPMFWGWCSIMYSPKDDCAPGADRSAHGNLPFLQWYINQIADYKRQHGIQLVDYIDFHWYPQGSGVALSSANDSNTIGMRLRSTKSLWDKTWTDESWIATTADKQLYVLPRVQSWIDAVSSTVDLEMSISEYNWGNDEQISAAIAQVDVLGLFAQYGVALAMRWVSPASGSVVENAFKLFTNYDGAGSAISGNLVPVTSSNIDSVASYAYAGSGDNTLYVILINKNASTVTPFVATGLTTSGSVTTYSFGYGSPSIRQGTQQVSSGGFSPALPGYSATLYVINK